MHRQPRSARSHSGFPSTENERLRSRRSRRRRLACYSGATFTPIPKLILASRSPQRRAILEQLGISFELHPSDVDERTEGPPAEVVKENALLKARAAAAAVGPGRLVLSV